MTPSRRRVTMRDVAERAGVSIKTVSNVVNDFEFIKDGTRERVLAAIEELGYTVNLSARGLRKGKSGFIGLAIPDLSMPYFAQLSALVIEQARRLGLRVLVEPTMYSREGELSVLHGAQHKMLDGLLYSPLELGQDDVDELAVPYPLVLLGERIFTPSIDHVATENVEGARTATAHLIDIGCRRIAVIGVHPGEVVGSAGLRFQGYREALAAHGIAFDEDLVVESRMWHRIDGVNAVNALLNRGIVPDGIVALNDMLAAGALHAIQMRGLRVPEDIAVVGFDNSDDSQYLSPSLTSLSPGLDEVARTAVTLLRDRIDGREPAGVGEGGHVFAKVPSTLVVRESTRR